eukprot:jgi/Chlat1/5511/Chrsp360S05337
MPRDMRYTGRFPPKLQHTPFEFFSVVRKADPEGLAKIMKDDEYYVTQDCGAGGPIHFAATSKQIDMIVHLLALGADVNQRDPNGLTALHRCAYLAHIDGYIECYEYLLSQGADPTLKTKDYDPYIHPGENLPFQLQWNPSIQSSLKSLDAKHSSTPKVRDPHEDIGDWWALHDYGLDTIKKWDKEYKHPYPEIELRRKEEEEVKAWREQMEGKKGENDNGVGNSGGDSVKVGPKDMASPESLRLPAVKSMLSRAKEVLGYDIEKLIAKGPLDQLNDTKYAQPALLIAALAAVELIKADRPVEIERCSAAAGLSLGEYPALVFAGALSFEDALKLVKVRAESMAAAAQLGRPHKMLSVIGLDDADIRPLIDQAKKSLPADTVLEVANYLFPQGRVVSGHKKGAIRATLLEVSGGFHTSLMRPASEALSKALSAVTWHDPAIPVYSNVTGKPFPDGKSIPELLARQLVEPVQWESTLKSLIQAGKKDMFEVGPGQQIKAMVKRMDQSVWKGFTNISG